MDKEAFQLKQLKKEQQILLGTFLNNHIYWEEKYKEAKKEIDFIKETEKENKLKEFKKQLEII